MAEKKKSRRNYFKIYFPETEDRDILPVRLQKKIEEDNLLWSLNTKFL